MLRLKGKKYVIIKALKIEIHKTKIMMNVT